MNFQVSKITTDRPAALMLDYFVGQLNFALWGVLGYVKLLFLKRLV
jgi:hypothetical protein